MTVYLTNRKTGRVNKFKRVQQIKSISQDVFSLSYKSDDGFISAFSFSICGYEIEILK